MNLRRRSAHDFSTAFEAGERNGKLCNRGQFSATA